MLRSEASRSYSYLTTQQFDQPSEEGWYARAVKPSRNALLNYFDKDALSQTPHWKRLRPAHWRYRLNHSKDVVQGVHGYVSCYRWEVPWKFWDEHRAYFILFDSKCLKMFIWSSESFSIKYKPWSARSLMLTRAIWTGQNIPFTSMFSAINGEDIGQRSFVCQRVNRQYWVFWSRRSLESVVEGVVG